MLDSDQRVSAAEALAHAYFSQYHDPDDEPEAEPYDESVEAKERTVEEWKGGPAEGRREVEPGPEGCIPPEAPCCLLPAGRKCSSSSPERSGRGTTLKPLQGGAARDAVGCVPQRIGAAQGRLWKEAQELRLPSEDGGPGRGGWHQISHVGVLGWWQHELTPSPHPSELTYQEVLSFEPPEPPQPPSSLETGQ